MIRSLSTLARSIADEEIFGLHGAIRLRVEGATGPADIFTSPQTREFFRKMHQRGPWAGYFLRLARITETSAIEQIVDLGTFMAVALCHVDEITYCSTSQGTALRYNGDQLCSILAAFQGLANELGSAIGLPDEIILKRNDLITETVISFFAAGQSIHQPKPKSRKRK